MSKENETALEVQANKTVDSIAALVNMDSGIALGEKVVESKGGDPDKTFRITDNNVPRHITIHEKE